MELALNILWFILALGGLLDWLRRKPGPLSGAQKNLAWRRGLVSLCCALVVLFPVISMTDDLHDEVAVLEKGRPFSKGLRDSNDDRASSNLDRLQTPPAERPDVCLFSFRCQPLGWVVCRDLAMTKLVFTPASAERAPPLFYR